MRRLAGALLLVPLLLAGCRDDAAPGYDQQVGDVESTLDAIESEVSGD